MILANINYIRISDVVFIDLYECKITSEIFSIAKFSTWIQTSMYFSKKLRMSSNYSPFIFMLWVRSASTKISTSPLNFWIIHSAFNFYLFYFIIFCKIGIIDWKFNDAGGRKVDRSSSIVIGTVLLLNGASLFAEGN